MGEKTEFKIVELEIKEDEWIVFKNAKKKIALNYIWLVFHS